MPAALPLGGITSAGLAVTVATRCLRLTENETVGATVSTFSGLTVVVTLCPRRSVAVTRQVCRPSDSAPTGSVALVVCVWATGLPSISTV